MIYYDSTAAGERNLDYKHLKCSQVRSLCNKNGYASLHMFYQYTKASLNNKQYYFNHAVTTRELVPFVDTITSSACYLSY